MLSFPSGRRLNPDLTKEEQALIARLREKGFVVCAWTPAEVQALRPGWSFERSTDELRLIAKDFAEQAQELGWEALEELLPKEPEVTHKKSQ